jgi:hypothetical protein
MKIEHKNDENWTQKCKSNLLKYQCKLCLWNMFEKEIVILLIKKSMMITQVRKINFSRTVLERSDQPKFYNLKLTNKIND